MFIKKTNESWFLTNTETGEMKELQETFVVNEEHWLKLYVDMFCMLCDKLSGASIKLMTIILKYAQKDESFGNFFMTNHPGLKKEIEAKGLSSNYRKYVAELASNGLIYRVSQGIYSINPQIAYCGNRADHAKLILKIEAEVRKEE